jgi:hypothetical protein
VAVRHHHSQLHRSHGRLLGQAHFLGQARFLKDVRFPHPPMELVLGEC